MYNNFYSADKRLSITISLERNQYFLCEFQTIPITTNYV